VLTTNDRNHINNSFALFFQACFASPLLSE
jgi:hypothetical protein